MATVTTTVALIGTGARTAAARLAGGAGNVSFAEEPDGSDDPLTDHERRLSAWREARRRPPVYTVVSYDPLAAVVDLWGNRLTGATNGDLESVVGITPAEPSPHYYLVSPELTEPAVHWYHGLLASMSAARIVLADFDPASLRRTVANLPTGPELPNLERVAAEARGYVPLPDLTLPA